MRSTPAVQFTYPLPGEQPNLDKRLYSSDSVEQILLVLEVVRLNFHPAVLVLTNVTPRFRLSREVKQRKAPAAKNGKQQSHENCHPISRLSKPKALDASLTDITCKKAADKVRDVSTYSRQSRRPSTKTQAGG